MNTELEEVIASLQDELKKAEAPRRKLLLINWFRACKALADALPGLAPLIERDAQHPGFVMKEVLRKHAKQINEWVDQYEREAVALVSENGGLSHEEAAEPFRIVFGHEIPPCQSGRAGEQQIELPRLKR